MTEPLQGKKILVVDDEPDLREIICMKLEMEGAQTESASCGNEAIEVVKQKAFDGVISDVRMQNGDGISLLGWMRKRDPKLPPLIFVTGQSDLSPDEMLKIGAAAVFFKPFDSNLLVETLAKVMKNVAP